MNHLVGMSYYRFFELVHVACYTTPNKAAVFLMLRFLAAAKLIPMQLIRNPANLKNAILEMERSSCGEREEANIERNTAGVTGIRLFESRFGGSC